jgi:hypothetical protein
MELEYKLAAIIGSCVNEGQLFTARQCLLKAETQLSYEEFVYLRKLADHKETALKQQMVDFANNTEAVAKDLQCTTIGLPISESQRLIALEPIPYESDGSPVITDFTDEELTTENVAKVASSIILK